MCAQVVLASNILWQRRKETTADIRQAFEFIRVGSDVFSLAVIEDDYSLSPICDENGEMVTLILDGDDADKSDILNAAIYEKI